MRLRFTKMHGAGNDFVVVDSRADGFDDRHPDADTRRALAHRHTGIGFDQMLVIDAPNSDDTDAYVRIFNADGSEVGQCGNGLRCIARFMTDHDTSQHQWRLDGRAGITEAQVHDDGLVSVALPAPAFGDQATGCIAPSPATFDGEQVLFVTVSMGNPHAVIAIDDAATADVARIGAQMQSLFSTGVNVGFSAQRDDGVIDLRVYERGVGETAACGSGACAAAVVAMRQSQTQAYTVNLPGGQLMVRWAGGRAPVWLTGPAQTVFEGHLEL